MQCSLGSVLRFSRCFINIPILTVKTYHHQKETCKIPWELPWVIGLFLGAGLLRTVRLPWPQYLHSSKPYGTVGQYRGQNPSYNVLRSQIQILLRTVAALFSSPSKQSSVKLGFGSLVKYLNSTRLLGQVAVQGG